MINDPKTRTLQAGLALAEAALFKIAKRVDELEEPERDATRAFANDPTEANAARSREARRDLEVWRNGHAAASANVAAAHQAIADAAAATRNARIEELARLASVQAIDDELEPMVAEIVAARRQEERARAAIARVQASQASHFAELEGLGVRVRMPALTVGRVDALIALARRQDRPLSDDDLRALARAADAYIDVQGADVMPFEEQLEWGLRGKEVVPEIARRRAAQKPLRRYVAETVSSIRGRIGAS
jgi:hypothetical protein